MKVIQFHLPKEFYEFVECHADDDPSKLRLEWHGHDPGFDIDFAVIQIECRRKFRHKLPSLVSEREFLFPSVVAGEQSTNEVVSRYHVSLIDSPISSVIDMTAGLGVDAISFARMGLEVEAVEIENFKEECLRHNASILGLKNLRTVSGDSTELYRSANFKAGTVVFIDPHRRDTAGGRVFGLKDCLPDVTELLPNWRGENIRVYLKLSPMLDIDRTIKDLPGVTRIWAVCYKGECKEILVEVDLADKSRDSMEQEGNHGPLITSVDLDDNGIISEFSCSHEFSKVQAPILRDSEEIEAGHYLYVPSAGMMKLGAWGAICARFPGLMKLSGSTPLFTSMWYYRSFPGRVLRIESTLGSSDLKKMKGMQMNVIARNFPLTADQLRKKAAVKDGGPLWLVGAKTGIKARPSLFLCNSELESKREKNLMV